MRTRSYYRKKKEINTSVCNNYMRVLVNTYNNNKLLVNTVALYMTWIMIHYTSSHLYTTYCTNLSFWGFISSPIIVTTPICRGLSWIIYTGSDKIFNMWNVMGTFLLTYASS
jgi:hypothetical protein